MPRKELTFAEQEARHLKRLGYTTRLVGEAGRETVVGLRRVRDLVEVTIGDHHDDGNAYADFTPDDLQWLGETLAALKGTA